MRKTIILAILLCGFSFANAQTCEETLDQIKKMSSGEDTKVLQLLNTLEQSGCIETVGVKSYYWNRGNLKSKLKDHQGAYEDLSKLIHLDMSPKDMASVLSSRGYNAMSLKKYNEAETDFLAALKLRPKLKKTWILLATTRLFKDERPGAVQAMEKLKAINPHDPTLLIEVAKFYYDFAFMEKAILVFKEYLALVPDDHKALFAIGMAHISNEEYSTAFEWFIRSFEANPEYVVALNNALAALLEDKKYDQAIETVLKHTIKRSEIDILKIRAYTYEAAGWCADAAHWYKEIAKISTMKTAPQFDKKADALLKDCAPEYLKEKDVNKFNQVD